jgi:hypothetical protein
MSRESRRVVSASITPSATAYTALDQVGGLLTFANVVDSAQGAGIIESLALIDTGKVDADLVLFLFSRPPMLAIDADPFTVSDGDMAYCLGTIAIAAADYKDVAAVNSVATKANIQLSIQNDETKVGSNLQQNIYGALRCTATPDWGVSDTVTIRLGVRR